jgi:N-glycosylase/DNA lyase
MPEEEVNLRLCFLGGQMFRFQEEAPGVFFGATGSEGYRLWREGAWVVGEGTGPQARLERLLRAGVQVAEVRARIEDRGPELAPLLGAFQGLRILRQPSRVEVFIGFLCSANNNLHRIMPMVRSLGELGAEIGDGLRGFPSLERVASLEEGELRSRGFGYRAPRVILAAREALERGGTAWLDDLAAGGYDRAWRELAEVKGIGRKLADCICLFGLDQGEAVPVDTHVWSAACRLYFPEWEGKAVTEARYQAVGDLFRSKFGSDAGWAHQFLFSGNLVRRRKDLALPMS